MPDGERRRSSIVRALLKDAPIILLDETTASLDVDSETEIQKALSKLIAGKTALIIAHRIRTVEAPIKLSYYRTGLLPKAEPIKN